MHIQVTEDLARTIDMLSTEIKLGDTVFAPDKSIIGEVWWILDDFETIEIEVKFKIIKNGETTELIPEKEGPHIHIQAIELITLNTRPFYCVKENN